MTHLQSNPKKLPQFRIDGDILLKETDSGIRAIAKIPSWDASVIPFSLVITFERQTRKMITADVIQYAVQGPAVEVSEEKTGPKTGTIVHSLNTTILAAYNASAQLDQSLKTMMTIAQVNSHALMLRDILNRTYPEPSHSFVDRVDRFLEDKAAATRHVLRETLPEIKSMMKDGDHAIICGGWSSLALLAWRPAPDIPGLDHIPTSAMHHVRGMVVYTPKQNSRAAKRTVEAPAISAHAGSFIEVIPFKAIADRENLVRIPATIPVFLEDPRKALILAMTSDVLEIRDIGLHLTKTHFRNAFPQAQDASVFREHTTPGFLKRLEDRINENQRRVFHRPNPALLARPTFLKNPPGEVSIIG